MMLQTQNFRLFGRFDLVVGGKFSEVLHELPRNLPPSFHPLDLFNVTNSALARFVEVGNQRAKQLFWRCDMSRTGATMFHLSFNHVFGSLEKGSEGLEFYAKPPHAIFPLGKIEQPQPPKQVAGEDRDIGADEVANALHAARH